jgi:outer membrane protein assembly factor BamB
MGIFLHAVDARTGEKRWSSQGIDRIDNVRIDHNYVHESGLSPQGHLLVVGDKLLVPNGRSMPAGIDRKTGRLLYYVQGYRNGDCRVIAGTELALVGQNGVINLHDGRETGSRWVAAGKDAPQGWSNKIDLFEGPLFPYKMIPACNAYSVLEKNVAYGGHQGTFIAYDLKLGDVSVYKKDFRGKEIHPAKWEAPERWRLDTPWAGSKPDTTLQLKAGNRLFGHVNKTLVALAVTDRQAELTWRHDLPETPVEMLAADGRLFAVTRDGSLHCFGADAATVQRHQPIVRQPRQPDDHWKKTAGELIAQSPGREGYCVVLGFKSGRLVDELVAQTDRHIIAVDADPESVDKLRRRLIAAGLYGNRVEVFTGDPFAFALPPYLASLVVSETADADSLLNKVSAEALAKTLRPYGGALCLTKGTVSPERFATWTARAKVDGSETGRSGSWLTWRRVGALPGTTSWTHESSDAARSYHSKDQLVKAPLGVLWYGDGPGYGFNKHKDYGHGVKPQVTGGRMFAFKISSAELHAVDVYTGRVMWKRSIDPVSRYASMPDGIHVAGGHEVQVFEPATGELRGTYELGGANNPDGKPEVADIRVSDDIILVAQRFAKKRRITEGFWDSTRLTALDRHSGRRLWSRDARHRFNNSALAIGAGLVFCRDSVAPYESQLLARRGQSDTVPESLLLAIDATTGQVAWQKTLANTPDKYSLAGFTTLRSNDDWLTYVPGREMLITGKNRRMRALNASDGGEVWLHQVGGVPPLIVAGDSFIDQSGHTYNTDTGRRVSTKPLFKRTGCNYATGGLNLLFLRDSCASYVEIETAEKHNLSNLRSGCSNSLVAADGLLNVPCFSVGCICNYPIQTSFTMVHNPAVAEWSGTPTQ